MSESLEALLAHQPSNKAYQQTIKMLIAELSSFNPEFHYSEDGVYIYINRKNSKSLPIPDYFVVYYFFFDDDELLQFAIQTLTSNPSWTDYEDIPSLVAALKALL